MDSYGFLYSDLFKELNGTDTNQPVFVLRAPVFQHTDLSNGGVGQQLLSGGVDSGSAFSSWSSVARQLIQNPVRSENDRLSTAVSNWVLFPGDDIDKR
jgi:hypothetical protein